MPTATLPPKLQRSVDELAPLDRMTRYAVLLDYGDALDPLPEAERSEERLVPGCVSRVWLRSACPEGRMRFRAAAEGQIAQGMVAMLVHGLDGEAPESVLAVEPTFIREAGLAEALTPARQGGLAAMLRRMQQDAARYSTADA